MHYDWRENGTVTVGNFCREMINERGLRWNFSNGNMNTGVEDVPALPIYSLCR